MGNQADRPRGLTQAESEGGAAHWDAVYATKPADTVSWHQREPTMSLDFVEALHLDRATPIVDIGAGASVLTDRLLDQGYDDLTAVDISDGGLAVSRARLGARAGAVTWRVEDVAAWTPPEGRYGLWHDRAVFHFLTGADARAGYMAALTRGLRPGGWLLMATFALDGPETCSGLPVRRYSAERLAETLGAGFRLTRRRAETHQTPGGRGQNFLWCLFHRL